MKGEVKLESLRRIEANQQKLYEQANHDLENREKELRLQAMRLLSDEGEKTRQQVYQAIDFAVRTLSWWNRNTENVMRLAQEYKQCIDAETQRLISIEVGKSIAHNGKERAVNVKEEEKTK